MIERLPAMIHVDLVRLARRNAALRHATLPAQACARLAARLVAMRRSSGRTARESSQKPRRLEVTARVRDRIAGGIDALGPPAALPCGDDVLVAVVEK
jgi:hypothetical protein